MARAHLPARGSYSVARAHLPAEHRLRPRPNDHARRASPQEPISCVPALVQRELVEREATRVANFSGIGRRDCFFAPKGLDWGARLECW